MLRLLLVAAAVAASLACAPCGHITISNTLATNYEGKDYNGTWKESCGVNLGSTGVWDWDPGWNEIWFDADAPGDRSWQGIDVGVTVGFPVARTVPGEVIEIDELYGGASINPCIDCPQDFAGLTEGTLRIVSGWTGDDPCEPDDGPIFKIAWDLVYGGGDGPTYEVRGTDAIQLSTFTTDACSSW